MTPSTLTFQLKNQFTSSSGSVYATIVGRAYTHNNDIFLLQAAPDDDLTKVTQNCAIELGPVGTSRTVTVAKLFSASIYFSIGNLLVFYLNKGSALVEPSVRNTFDHYYNTHWGFCEFTYNDTELFCNSSYVDFIGLPIALDLTTESRGTERVKGIATGRLDSITTAMQSQSRYDGQPWKSLVITDKSAKILRVLGPNQGILMDGSRFARYYEPYVQSS